VCDLAWSPTEDLLAAVNQYGLWLVQADDADAVPELVPFEDATSVAFSPDGETIAITACHIYLEEDRACESLIAIYDISSGVWQEFNRYDFELSDIMFSPDGLTLAAEQSKAQAWGLRLIDLVTKDESTITDPIRTNAILTYAFSPDGRYLANVNATAGILAEMVNGVIVWDLATGERIAETEGNLHLRDVMFSSDSSKIIYVDASGIVTERNFLPQEGDGVAAAIISERLFSPVMIDILHTFVLVEQPAYLLASLLDDYRPTNRSLYAWDLTTNTEVFFYDMPLDRNIEQIALSASGQYFSAASAVMDDRLLDIWHIESGAHRQFTLTPDA
jgi:WD40 repeat protein